MADGVVRIEPVVLGTAAMLRAATARPVGAGLAPPGAASAIVPYFVVEAFLGVAGQGSLAEPEEQRPVVVIVASVGVDEKQSLWWRDRAAEAILARDDSQPGNPYVNAIDVDGGDGAYIVGRRGDGFGGTDGAGTLRSSAERFVLEVHCP